MPRKPVHLELKGGKGLRQIVWERIRSLNGAEFSLVDVVKGGEATDTVRDYIEGLARAGYLTLTQTAITNGNLQQRRSRRWKLARDTGADAPRVRRDGTPVTQGLAQERMWRCLRMLKGDINAKELAAHASIEGAPVKESTANDYLLNLRLAGYCEITKDAQRHQCGKAAQRARYRLISNTGPRPPMVQRTDTLYDPNLGAVVWIRPINEETAIYGH